MNLVHGHATINFFSWVMPASFKVLLNRGRPHAEVAVPEGLPDKILEPSRAYCCSPYKNGKKDRGSLLSISWNSRMSSQRRYSRFASVYLPDSGKVVSELLADMILMMIIKFKKKFYSSCRDELLFYT